MKRTAAMFAMVAGLGGCVSPDKDKAGNSFGKATLAKPVPGMMGPTGDALYTKPKSDSKTTAKSAKMPSSGAEIVQASATMTADPAVQQTAGFSRVIGGRHSDGGCDDGSCGAPGRPHLGGRLQGHFAKHAGPGAEAFGPTSSGFHYGIGHGAGILPVPAMGPWGATVAVGAGGPGGGMGGPLYANQRTHIRFVSPAAMKIAWQSASGGFSDATPLEVPARYNFPQGNIYRLKLSAIPNRPGSVFYPTLEIYPATANTITFLAHAPVPIGFTDEDFDQVKSGNLVVKVVYMPHPTFQDLAAAGGAEEVVSTRLEPGVDPIVEANRRGTILAVIRIGNIDLQDPNTPAMDAPPGAPAGLPPGARISSGPIETSSPPVIASPMPFAPPASLPTTVKPIVPVAPPTATLPPTVVMPPVVNPVKTPAPLPNAVKTPVIATPVSMPLNIPPLPGVK